MGRVHGQTQQGSKLSFFPGSQTAISKSFLKVLCIENSTSLGSLQKYEGAAGDFNGAQGSWYPFISSPVQDFCLTLMLRVVNLANTK